MPMELEVLMEMLWPGSLWLLSLIPIIIAAYIWGLRQGRFAVRYSSLALVRQALCKQSHLRRHLPFGFYLLALASLIVALARPQTMVKPTSDLATIILAIDVSLSMCQTDIPPNRLEAAKSAAMSFIENQEANTQIGIVAFAGFAELVQEPTTDKEKLQAAIRGLSVARNTAIGSAILTSVDAIAEEHKDVAPTTDESLPETSTEESLVGDAPYMIVLLTDGVSNSGPKPLEAARKAAARGVRVYTIGFGTAGASGVIPPCGGQVGPGFGAGGIFGRGIDEIALEQVSSLTSAQYYSAESVEQLQEVFEKLPTYPIIQDESMEISVLFTVLGALMVMAALALSLIWNPLS